MLVPLSKYWGGGAGPRLSTHPPHLPNQNLGLTTLMHWRRKSGGLGGGGGGKGCVGPPLKILGGGAGTRLSPLPNPHSSYGNASKSSNLNFGLTLSGML